MIKLRLSSRAGLWCHGARVAAEYFILVG